MEKNRKLDIDVCFVSVETFAIHSSHERGPWTVDSGQPHTFQCVMHNIQICCCSVYVLPTSIVIRVVGETRRLQMELKRHVPTDGRPNPASAVGGRSFICCTALPLIAPVTS